MFEKELLTATPLGPGPAVADDVVWHPDLGEWVSLQPCDPVLELERRPAGPDLAVLLDLADTSGADGHALVEAAAACARMAAWAAAKEAKMLAALAARPELRPAATGYRSVNPITNTAVVVAGRCQLTARQAENDVGHAAQLVVDFPDTHAALGAGLIDMRRVRVITDELGGQDPAIRSRVEAAVLPVAPTMDSVALRKLIKRLLLELAPVEAAERHRVARDGRYVSVMPASDGMAFLEALMPAEDLAALNTTLNVAAADAKRADTAAGLPARTKDQRRADALAELGWAALSACADAATGHTATTGGDASDRGSTSPVPGHPSGDVAAGSAATTAASDGPADRGSAHPVPGHPFGNGATGRAATSSANGARGGTSGGTTNRRPFGMPVHTATTEASDEPADRDSTNPAPGHRSGDGAAGSAATGSANGARGGTAGVTTNRHSSGTPADTATGDPPGRTARGTPGGTPRRRPVSVHVTVPFTTLAGLDDQPGELEGYGPIPAHVARELAAGGVWRWLRTDPGTGELLDLGRTRYRPTKALADFIVARDRTCRMPGCHRPASTADIDHIVAFADGGTTCPAGCHALCEMHHLLKHHGDWRVERQRDGTTVWISPTGHRYAKPPERIGPVIEPNPPP